MVASLRVSATKHVVCGHAATQVRAAPAVVARIPSMTRARAQNTRPMMAVNAVPQNVNAAAAANPTIRIKLKSYWTDLLQDTVEKIAEVASATGATISGPVPLPTRKRVYTVLRSPHVNKKSREQFEVRTHQRLIDIKDLSTQTIDRLMELDLPAGVDVEVKL
jgi:small subunit ribosomal protein S10